MPKKACFRLREYRVWPPMYDSRNLIKFCGDLYTVPIFTSCCKSRFIHVCCMRNKTRSIDDWVIGNAAFSACTPAPAVASASANARQCLTMAFHALLRGAPYSYAMFRVSMCYSEFFSLSILTFNFYLMCSLN